ncbi:hypothetical protein HAX54_006543 [Datura stramonium]|uniref:Uncharacterized protein n=1 Tax=Datura stramonium TaxID=4076 RepID=A0ABS8RV34_DATST|nr:hypothetical protein [Datura stramonium]
MCPSCEHVAGPPTSGLASVGPRANQMVLARRRPVRLPLPGPPLPVSHGSIDQPTSYKAWFLLHFFQHSADNLTAKPFITLHYEYTKRGASSLELVLDMVFGKKE